MNQPLRRRIDNAALRLCRVQPVNRLIQYLAYQRKRVLRRDLETRLHAAGEYGDEVQRGPFQGLKYLPVENYASCRFEKIIGAYEHEIHPWIEELAADRNYATILNVGAAEGFYTSGLARLFPSARVLSYESTEAGRDYGRELAKLNGVADRVEIHATCSVPELLQAAITAPVLVMMDVDSAESRLLDPQEVPWLRKADILVEMHECFQSGINDLIEGRFKTTHTIRKIRNAGLAYARYPALQSLRFEEIYALVAEDRPSLQDWFLMQPNES